jgi:NAD(P)-dependent dehydrogenase (short-subunit alcohol dehydrogenase family)
MASETKVVVVTGASAGLGRAIAHAFAERGAKVALLARNPEALAAAAAECRERGGEALAIPTDVSDADAVERAASEVEEKLGPIDVWVNDAMVSVFSPVKEMEASDYKRVTEVLYLGFVHGTLAARKHRAVRPLLAVKLAGDAGMAGFNVVRQVVSFGKICSWCTGTAVATAVMVASARVRRRR